MVLVHKLNEQDWCVRQNACEMLCINLQDYALMFFSNEDDENPLIRDQLYWFLREIVAVFKKSFAMSRANKTKDNIAHNKNIHRKYVRSSLHQ